jgi:hypothetical protein
MNRIALHGRYSHVAGAIVEHHILKLSTPYIKTLMMFAWEEPNYLSIESLRGEASFGQKK